ncbi:hypothetical protein JB92DRAFT_2841995 [Gautieria morchelliformis]|nr:hypothetical protein JB92DRAFT_2841995 [Gautieria morchelliformis]
MAYLWFSNTLGAHNSPAHRVRFARRSSSGFSDASTAALQFTPSAQFDHFMQKLLQTTQKENDFTSGHSGSEFRVAVVALIMANKFGDE